jgi:hypothetical protein
LGCSPANAEKRATEATDKSAAEERVMKTEYCVTVSVLIGVVLLIIAMDRDLTRQHEERMKALGTNCEAIVLIK